MFIFMWGKPSLIMNLCKWFGFLEFSHISSNHKHIWIPATRQFSHYKVGKLLIYAVFPFFEWMMRIIWYGFYNMLGQNVFSGVESSVRNRIDTKTCHSELKTDLTQLKAVSIFCVCAKVSVFKIHIWVFRFLNHTDDMTW